MAWDPPWDLGSVMRELYLFSFWVEAAADGGDSTAIDGGDWTALEVEARTDKGARGWPPFLGVGGFRVARGPGVTSAACMVERGGDGGRRGFWWVLGKWNKHQSELRLCWTAWNLSPTPHKKVA